MGGYQRKERVADLIKKEVAEILQRKIRDPRLQGITITSVRMTDDLKEATIFYCDTFKKIDRAVVNAAILSASGFIRKELAGKVYLRYLPRLNFHYDDSFDYEERIESIIKTIKGEEGKEQ